MTLCNAGPGTVPGGRIVVTLLLAVSDGKLRDIAGYCVQNGVVFTNAQSNIDGVGVGLML